MALLFKREESHPRAFMKIRTGTIRWYDHMTSLLDRCASTIDL